MDFRELPTPSPSPEQVLLQIKACAVCRTDLHVLDGDLHEPKLPLILGHEIVGTVMECGKNVKGFQPGDLVGVPWLGKTCGECVFCRKGMENLCDSPGFTGYNIDGGYATHTVADHSFCFKIPSVLAQSLTPQEIAPLLCAGLIGWRSYRMAGEFESLGLYGFGAAAHIIAQVATANGKAVYAFTRPGDEPAQKLAMELGCVWAGDSDNEPPELLDAAIIFAPIGALVPAALRTLKKGGTVVCGGIHMTDIPSFPYELLWGERKIVSVANLTRADAVEFFEAVSQTPVHTKTTVYSMKDANDALEDLREGRLVGAACLVI
ncbi:MAG: zinc-dependent alcohol dehydrogenase family protein [Cyanobacteria bacterium]|nr:zinc-dependent alcohol dehydrogenase family protein [Cyanobacteriota bacterium]